MNKNVIFLIGLPGSGKSTVAQLFKNKYNYEIISSSKIMSELENSEDLEKEYINKGLAIPDEIYASLVKKQLIVKKNGNYIVDGFPYNMKQVFLANKILEETNSNLISVIYIDASEKTIMSRIKNRKICPECLIVYDKKDICPICGEKCIKRVDDDILIYKKRLSEHKKWINEVIEYYTNNDKLVVINSNDNNIYNKEIMTKILKI